MHPIQEGHWCGPTMQELVDINVIVMILLIA